MTAQHNTVERFNGEVYVFYAGPFYSDEQARQKVYQWVHDDSDFSYVDNPVIYRRAVYVRSR